MKGTLILCKNRPAVLNWTAAFAALAALLVGFVFQMPAYYLTWGRFTLLTGLVVLGPAMAAALDVFKGPDRRDAFGFAWYCWLPGCA